METGEQSGERAPGWSWLVLIGICLLLLIIGVAKSCNEEKESEDKKVATWTWVVTKSQTISINGEYSAIYYLSKGEGLSFKNSTQPYCVENENGHSVCGEKGEDLSPKLPREDNNMELKFRTSSEKTGEVTLVYWEKVLSLSYK